MTSIAERLATRLLEREMPYDPFEDLRQRPGVDLRWHSGSIGKWDRPLGVTNYNNLSVTLRTDQYAAQLRMTVAHELVHLDRGPREHTGKTEQVEERIVNRLAVQRLIDPITFDLLMELRDGKPVNRDLWSILNIDRHGFRHYKSWRKGVKESTAMAAYERFTWDRLPTWPAPWIDQYEMPKRFAAARPSQD